MHQKFEKKKIQTKPIFSANCTHEKPKCQSNGTPQHANNSFHTYKVYRWCYYYIFFFISFKHIIRTHGRYEILYVLAVSGSIVPLNKCICADYITWKEKTDPNRSLCNMISLCIDSYVCESVIDSDFFSFIIFSLLLLLFCFAQQYIVFVIIWIIAFCCYFHCHNAE